MSIMQRNFTHLTNFVFTSPDGKRHEIQIVNSIFSLSVADIKCKSGWLMVEIDKHRMELLEKCNAKTLRAEKYAPAEMVLPNFWLHANTCYIYGIISVEVKIVYAKEEDPFVNIHTTVLIVVEMNTADDPTFEHIASLIEATQEFRDFAETSNGGGHNFKIADFFRYDYLFKRDVLFSLNDHILAIPREDLFVKTNSIELCARTLPDRVLEAYYGHVL
jgi:hypothetical protein